MEFLIILKTVLMGIIEGITEFLPVSSTGHLIILDKLIDFKKHFTGNFVESFQVIIQLGAILSVVFLYFNRLVPKLNDKKDINEKINIWSKVVVGVFPAAVLGLLFDDFIESKLFNPIVVSIALVVYGIILILIENKNKGKQKFEIENLKDLSYKNSIKIGFFQCLAMVPGTSRSAATIIGGMTLGLDRKSAAEFSFFLAIPTMFGASLLKILKNGFNFTKIEWQILGLGFFVSFIVALIVIKLFMNYIKSKDFKIFAYYRIIIGILFLILIFDYYRIIIGILFLILSFKK